MYCGVSSLSLLARKMYKMKHVKLPSVSSEVERWI